MGEQSKQNNYIYHFNTFFFFRKADNTDKQPKAMMDGIKKNNFEAKPIELSKFYFSMRITAPESKWTV